MSDTGRRFGELLARDIQIKTVHDQGLEIARLRQALEDVVNPLGRIKRQADALGERLSGMAYQIANSLSYVQSIARDALSSQKREQQ